MSLLLSGGTRCWLYPVRLVVVEWADKIREQIPSGAFFMSVALRGDERVFTADFLGER